MPERSEEDGEAMVDWSSFSMGDLKLHEGLECCCLVINWRVAMWFPKTKRTVPTVRLIVRVWVVGERWKRCLKGMNFLVLSWLQHQSIGFRIEVLSIL